ncbi:hypothetical protein [Natronincola ferrireducens]|nr:hypothetical protein [Natronincola ferrireducens]
MKKRLFSILLAVMLIFSLVQFVFAGTEDCTSPKVNPTTGSYDSIPILGPNPIPSSLEAPEGCILKAFKIDLDENELVDGIYKVGDDDTASTDLNSKFQVTITNNGDTFAWASTMPVFHVYVKGGNQGGNLYSYYPKYPQGVYNDCGLKQPANNPNNTGSGWSHITFYYCEKPMFYEETAWAYGGNIARKFTSIEGLNANNWGWTNGPISEGEYVLKLWAGAGQNNLDNGIHVGNVIVDYKAGTVIVNYDIFSGYALQETHLWIGNQELPSDRRGRLTNAPGQLGFKVGEEYKFNGDIYVAAHAVVGIPAVD